MVSGLRGLGGPWEGIQIVATAEQIGVRDGRRIVGRYMVNKEDLVKGVRHDDAVTRATFGVDIHATTAEHNKTKSPIHATDIKVKPYDIPLRALIAKDVDGLMMAGRALVEVSGGITLARIASLAELGVDVVSVGALTHSAPAADIGLDIERIG